MFCVCARLLQARSETKWVSRECRERTPLERLSSPLRSSSFFCGLRFSNARMCTRFGAGCPRRAALQTSSKITRCPASPYKMQPDPVNDDNHDNHKNNNSNNDDNDINIYHWCWCWRKLRIVVRSGSHRLLSGKVGGATDLDREVADDCKHEEHGETTQGSHQRESAQAVDVLGSSLRGVTEQSSSSSSSHNSSENGNDKNTQQRETLSAMSPQPHPTPKLAAQTTQIESTTSLSSTNQPPAIDVTIDDIDARIPPPPPPSSVNNAAERT